LAISGEQLHILISENADLLCVDRWCIKQPAIILRRDDIVTATAAMPSVDPYGALAALLKDNYRLRLHTAAQVAPTQEGPG
jgi:hypothetical protein